MASSFVLAGALGNLLKLRSTLGGTLAYMNVQGSSSASCVDVEDISALPGNNIPMDSCSIKGPNTPGWLLTPEIPLLPPLAAALLLGALLALSRRRLAAC